MKEYLICIDSDGCAMDTMNRKHDLCFGPEWVKQFGLESVKKEALAYWNRINLFSKTRGINRFKGLAKGLKWAEGKGYTFEGLDAFITWTEETTELSNPALLKVCQEEKNTCMEEALLWSIHVNLAIKRQSESGDGPFENVKEVMEQLNQEADLAAVSSANAQALEEEWTKYGLKNYCQELLSQEAGTKAECIRGLLKKGYKEEQTVMVGDAIGDYEAAVQNGVWFYPIVAGQEVESWEKLKDDAYPRLKKGEFTAEYQKNLLWEFENALEGR
ncbi:MAG: HAD family hydrolase [Lachnospiraceae bacterium]|jgi:phosphoglycolate phosphatase-like HAD superfamily hydrolase|nr:HAD family hydrolase [Lachnospiraceae bacterium]